MNLLSYSHSFIDEIFNVSRFTYIWLWETYILICNILFGIRDALSFTYLKQQIKNPEIRQILVSSLCFTGIYTLIIILIEYMIFPLYLNVISLQHEKNPILYFILKMNYYLLYIVYTIFWVWAMLIWIIRRNGMWLVQLTNILPLPLPVRRLPSTIIKQNAFSTFFGSLIQSLSESAMFSILLIFYMGINSVVAFLPHSGYYLAWILQCMLASFYAFQSHWTRSHPQAPSIGVMVFVEQDWAYFLGFGAPITLLTNDLPLAMSLALYSALMPLCVIMAGRPKAYAWRSKDQRYQFKTWPHSVPFFDLGRSFVPIVSSIFYKMRRWLVKG